MRVVIFNGIDSCARLRHRLGTLPMTAHDLTSHPWFFCGIGGSGMLPLALILRGRGAAVAGSDRSYDQGRTPEKFSWLAAQGFTLFPQDGSGITAAAQTLVASAAVEDTVPEVVRARELGCARLSRAQLLSTLFNAAPLRLGIAGTSGKSTVTGMAGFILDEAGRDPTIMNGAVMKNYATPGSPFASARVGAPDAPFVAEVDESDGSIALYNPSVAVLNNISLDHKSLEELRALFGAFLARAGTAIVNVDDAESAALLASLDAAGRLAAPALTFGVANTSAHIGIVPGSVEEGPTSVAAMLTDRRAGLVLPLRLAVPGRHNLSNALAALAATHAAGVPLATGVAALARFGGLARRFDIVGTTPSGITVIDDFGHNPDKVAATLATLKASPGPVVAFFQPHGFGPLRQMGDELAATFARLLGPGDEVIFCDPVYFGGTVDRSEGSERVLALIGAQGGERGPKTTYISNRNEVPAHLLTRLANSIQNMDNPAHSTPQTRVVIMGARDDTLTAFASQILATLS
jgi:UDP-N-acetylmuramate--alanine ligase